MWGNARGAKGPWTLAGWASAVYRTQSRVDTAAAYPVELRSKPNAVRVCRPWLKRRRRLGRLRKESRRLKPYRGNPYVRDFRGA